MSHEVRRGHQTAADERCGSREQSDREQYTPYQFNRPSHIGDERGNPFGQTAEPPQQLLGPVGGEVDPDQNPA